MQKLVGETGKVFSFDIQCIAISKIRDKLEKNGLSEKVELINAGHQYLDSYVKAQLSAVMFNLGYLPGGNHSISTTAETTIEALKKSMELLKTNGIITIVIYHGGDTGFEEKEQVMEFVKSIDSGEFTVSMTEFINQPNYPPILVCIEKLK